MPHDFLMSTTYLLTHAPSLHWRRRDPEIVIFLDFNFSFSDGLWQVGSHGEWFEANFLASILTDTKSSISSIPSSFYLPFFNVGKAKRLGKTNVIKVLGRVEKKTCILRIEITRALYFLCVQEPIFINFFMLFPMMFLGLIIVLKVMK